MSRLAIIIAAAVAMIIGAVWYADGVFGKSWRKMNGFNKEAIQKDASKAMAGMLAALIVMAFVLSRVIAAFGALSAAEGIEVGVWMWLGFVGTIGVAKMLFEKRPLKLFAIDSGYYLVSLVVMGGIIAAW